mmetsp:Transcript_55606/g.118420  ORF Transcript_55606/g.118420 Transcript_55606/m.118420 type:complete len:334 (-) Transcript_55606:541-1542(-)
MDHRCFPSGDALCDGVAASSALAAALRFNNDDACGDWVFPFGAHDGLQFQAVNALSAGCFVAAGLPLARNASAPITRGYGLLLCCVGLGSFSYHATTAASGFIIDIAPMAATAGFLVFKGLHGMQAIRGIAPTERTQTHRLLVAAGCSFFAVYIPWALMALGFMHEVVWGVWALLFGSMGAAFGVMALLIFLHQNIIYGQPGRDLAIAIACILLGLGCSIHSFIPGLCSGWRTIFPLHALWHLISSITGNRCGRMLDTVANCVIQMEEAPQGVHSQEFSADVLLMKLLTKNCLTSKGGHGHHHSHGHGHSHSHAGGASVGSCSPVPAAALPRS